MIPVDFQVWKQEHGHNIISSISLCLIYVVDNDRSCWFYYFQSFGGGDFDGEFWVERCCPTKLEYTMHLELLEKLKGQLFLFHGTTWNRVEVCRFNWVVSEQYVFFFLCFIKLKNIVMKWAVVVFPPPM